MVGRAGALLGATLAALLLAATPALAGSTTASSGAVTATLSWHFNAKTYRYSDLRLQIVRSGVVAYSAPVTDRDCYPTTACMPAVTTRSGNGSLYVRNLSDGTGEPQVIVSIDSGGANCCFVDDILRYVPATGHYALTRHDFQYAGATMKDLSHNGQTEFVTADGRFKYQFTDGAASGQPLQILAFSGGRFIDVTRRYPKLIAKDAAGWLRTFRQVQSYHDTVGVIAAWAADEDLLGHSRMVAAYLAEQVQRGTLTVPQGSAQPGGERFVKSLQRFLRKLGYLR